MFDSLFVVRKRGKEKKKEGKAIIARKILHRRPDFLRGRRKEEGKKGMLELPPEKGEKKKGRKEQRSSKKGRETVERTVGEKKRREITTLSSLGKAGVEEKERKRGSIPQSEGGKGKESGPSSQLPWGEKKRR